MLFIVRNQRTCLLSQPLQLSLHVLDVMIDVMQVHYIQASVLSIIINSSWGKKELLFLSTFRW